MDIQDFLVQEMMLKQDTASPVSPPVSYHLPPDWRKEIKLSEIANILMGQSPPGETYNPAGIGKPLINGPAEYGPIYPKPVQWTTKPERLCKVGDVLFCVRGNTTGRINIADQEYCIGRGIAAIHDKPNDSDTVFIRYLLEFKRPLIYRIAVGGGSTFPNISGSQLKELIVDIPPLPQQRAIALVLRTVQKSIQSRRDELELERERMAALMEYLFTHGTRGETTKQTEIGEVPESWQVVELGEIITLHRGYDLPSKDRKPGIVPIISSSGISGTHSEAKVTAPGVVTGRYGTIGEVFYIEQDFWPLNTTLYVSEFRRVTPHFVAFLLRTLNFNIFNDKSTVPGVNRNDLHRIKTVLPPPSEQQDIVDVLCNHDTKLSALEQETTLLEELFCTLLEELMTGWLSTLPLIEEGETYD